MIAFSLSFIGIVLFYMLYATYDIISFIKSILQSRRGVSQILATILLIGMTIVLIAVLYALILPMFDIDTSLPWD